VKTGGKTTTVRAQLLELLRDRAEGDRVPSERELSAICGVARMTLRRALDELVAEGLLVRERGRGTFVGRPRMVRHLSINSFTEQMRQQGQVPSSRLLEFREMRAGVRQARQLRIPVAEPVVRFTRLRLADDAPIGLETTWVASTRVPGLCEADVAGSWYELLADAYSLTIAQGSSMIEPALLSARDARLLDTATGQAAFRIETTTFAADGSVVDFEVDVYRGDRYRLTADLRPQPALQSRNGSTIARMRA
jgi:GntR family transcriptional regulator